MSPNVSPTSCVDENRASAFFAGQLDDAAIAVVEAHVDGCADCRRLLSEMARGLLSRSTPRPASDDTLSPARGLSTGDSIGRYVIIERVGSGGMGVVYSAYDPELGRRVAIKLLRHISPAGRDGDETDPYANTQAHTRAEASQRRLLREAQVLARLAHPNVVTVFDVGMFGDQLFLAMELIDGGTVFDWLLEKPRDWRQIRDVFCAAGAGLRAAHQAGVVHRDFKPENVLVGKDGRVCVTDFGLSHAPNEAAPPPGSPSPSARFGDPHFTVTGAVLGTPAYMAPEQERGQTDERSDQYSFCVALSESLNGKLPAREGSVGRSLLPPVAGVPSRIRRAIARGLSVDPTARHRSMAALLDALAYDPAAVRRRWIWAASALLLVSVSSGVLLRSYLLRRRCAGGAGLFERVLPAERWARLRAARQSAIDSAPKLAADTARHWDSLLGYLTNYQARWINAHGEVCEATAVRGTQSPHLRDQRMECLGRLLPTVDALATVLERADRETAARVVRASDVLSPVKPCLEVVESPENLDPATRAKVAEVRARDDRGAALFRAGAIKDALQSSNEQVAAARAIGYRPLLAEVLVTRGVQEEQTSDGPSAERDLLEAIPLLEATRSDLQVPQARVALLHVEMDLLNRPAEARKLFPLAQASIDRIGGDPEEESSLLNMQANLEDSEGHPDQARKLYQQRIDLLMKQPPSDGRALDLGSTENNLGTLEGGLHHPVEARAHFERAIELESPILGAQHPDVLLVRLNRNQCIEPADVPDLRDILRLEEQQLGPDHLQVARVLSRLGDALNERAATRAEAVTVERRALKILAAQLDPTHVDVINARGTLGEMLLAEHAYAEAEKELAASKKAAAALPPLVQELSMEHADALLGLGRTKEAKAELESKAAVPDPSDAMQVARYRFIYARVLWVDGSKKQSHALALQAVNEFDQPAPPAMAPRDEIRALGHAWLATH